MTHHVIQIMDIFDLFSLNMLTYIFWHWKKDVSWLENIIDILHFFQIKKNRIFKYTYSSDKECWYVKAIKYTLNAFNTLDRKCNIAFDGRIQITDRFITYSEPHYQFCCVNCWSSTYLSQCIYLSVKDRSKKIRGG